MHAGIHALSDPHSRFARRAAAALPALLAAAGLVVSASTGASLRAERRAALPPAEAALRDAAPPLVNFASVVLGGFRGILADVLWLRADAMQEQRRFVELVQLADWITALEPRNEEVWVFHAWNMAYNVSYLMAGDAERWNWVRRGISLLRDRGLPLNPRSATLMRELGWIFQHKIGMDADDAHAHYRRRWALEAGSCLGPDGSVPAEGSPEAARLASELRMDRAFMARLEERFGRIDWRVPDASSLYWSMLALDSDPPRRERLRCRAMAYQSLVCMATDTGVFDEVPSGPDAPLRSRPNTALVPATADFLEESLRASDFSGIRFAYVNFLSDASLLRVQEGRIDEARALYARLEAFFASVGLASEVPSFAAHVRASGLRSVRLLRDEAAALRGWAAQDSAAAEELLAEAARLDREASDLHARLAVLLPTIGDPAPLPAPQDIPEPGDGPFAELLMKAGFY